jgi:hypothetical protein
MNWSLEPAGSQSETGPTLHRGRPVVLVSGKETEMKAGSTNFRGTRWGVLAGTVALGIASIGITASALPSGATTGGSHGTTQVLECRSGVETNGDVSTASSFAVRVPADQLPDTIPGDCVVSNG